MVWQVVVLPGAHTVTFTYMMFTALWLAAARAAGPSSTTALATLLTVALPEPPLPELPELPPEEVETSLPPPPPQAASNSDAQIRPASNFRKKVSPQDAAP